MATLRQYYETDFDYAIRVKVRLGDEKNQYEGAVFFDASALSSFLACYFPGTTQTYDDFIKFLRYLNYGSSPLNLDGGIVLPAAKQFPGQLRVHNTNPFAIEYQLFGDPSWRNLFQINMTRRVFIYSESNLSPFDITKLQTEAEAMGHILQFRGGEYVQARSKLEKPQAFISHDSRDKETIARPIAINLQRKLCPVWYDEFSLSLGDNLRQSIEKGLRECKKCVLILSPNFFANKGWGKKEFESIFTREILEETQLVLPIWCGVTKQNVYDYSPSLLNVKGVDWNTLGEEEVCRQIFLAVTKNPDTS